MVYNVNRSGPSREPSGTTQFKTTTQRCVDFYELIEYRDAGTCKM